VSSGLLDMVPDEGQASVIRTLGRGEILGELALLTGSPRSTGARARRDSQLVRLARDDFERLLHSHPGFAIALTRVLGERLQLSRSPGLAAQRAPRIITLVPLHDGLVVTRVAERLARSLGSLGSLARMQSEIADEAEVLDRLEADHDRVLMVAASSRPEDPWTDYCLRQADRIVGMAERPPQTAHPFDPRLAGCDLAYLAATNEEPAVSGWLDALTPRAVHILREGHAFGASVDRVARRLAGRSLGIVLSGGGARGFSHIGVIEELEDSGFIIDRIGGASMGAMVGALFAVGHTAAEVTEILRTEYVERNPLSDRTLPLTSLFRGMRGAAMMRRVFGERTIEGLDQSFYCVSCDLAAQQLVVHRRGLLAEAIGGAQALPAYLPPLSVDGRMLVDGGVMNNLPVEPMATTGEGPVVAVDVIGRLARPGPPRSRVPWLRRWIVGSIGAAAPSLGEVILRSILLGGAATDATARARADVVITPQLAGTATLSFKNIDAIRAAGRRAARETIEAGTMEILRPGQSS
jgi:predicted acylesterase/phospholipase RssA/CRP-like cAMP-binding protein